MSAPETHVQAYVELRAEDPEAVSALQVARERLAAGRTLRSLRRLRVFEITGPLPGESELAALLHHSTRFYNPAKERCTLRATASASAPFAADEQLVCVVDRGLERRAAAERWWRHETGSRVQVREAVVWALRFEPGGDAAALAESLAVVRDRATGLLSNPHFQDRRAGDGAAVPWEWFARRSRARKGGSA